MDVFTPIAQALVRAIWIALFTDWVIEILLLGRDREYLLRTRHIWQCRLFGITVVLVFAATLFTETWSLLTTFTYPAVKIAGLLLFILGAVLHVSSRIYLGKNWSSEARVRPGHKLVMHGPYALVRHPVYLSEIIMAFGTATVFGNWLILVLTVALMWSAVYQARIEEKLLARQFRAEIEAYKQSTPMLLPTVSSFKAGARDLFRGSK